MLHRLPMSCWRVKDKMRNRVKLPNPLPPPCPTARRGVAVACNRGCSCYRFKLLILKRY